MYDMTLPERLRYVKGLRAINGCEMSNPYQLLHRVQTVRFLCRRIREGLTAYEKSGLSYYPDVKDVQTIRILFPHLFASLKREVREVRDLSIRDHKSVFRDHSGFFVKENNPENTSTYSFL